MDWYRKPGSILGDLPTTDRRGYDLIGWIDEEGNSAYPSTVIEDDGTGIRTFTARWQASVFRISYEMGGVSTPPTGDDYPTTYTINSPTITPPPYPNAVTGHTFQKWEPTSIPSGSIGDKTFTADWGLNLCKVTWNSNGGTSVEHKMVVYGQQVGVLPTTAKQGYGFTGWYK